MGSFLKIVFDTPGFSSIIGLFAAHSSQVMKKLLMRPSL